MLNIYCTSETAILCSLPAPAELSKQQRIWTMADYLTKELYEIDEVVVGMNNFTVFFKINANIESIIIQIRALWDKVQTITYEAQVRCIEIPVHYGGEYIDDLKFVASYHQTTVETIIERHTAPTYTVFMMGFQPGFPYLGGLPENLHTPRRDVPRTRVPAGSVGIGGSQTGIYPFTSPGGWQLLGKTSITLFDASQQPPVLLKAGDQVKFVVESISL